MLSAILQYHPVQPSLQLLSISPHQLFHKKGVPHLGPEVILNQATGPAKQRSEWQGSSTSYASSSSHPGSSTLQRALSPAMVPNAAGEGYLIPIPQIYTGPTAGITGALPLPTASPRGGATINGRYTCQHV